MKNQDKRNEVIVALAKAYEDGNLLVINQVESILTPNKTELKPALQKVLNSFGSNPLDEKEFYEIFSDGNKFKIETASARGLDVDDFNAVEIAQLANRVIHKVTSKLDDDGIYKTTPNIDKMKLPKTSQLGELTQMTQDGKSEEELMKKAYEYAGLSEGDLTEWEAHLVQDIVLAYMSAVNQQLIDNVSNITPFSRYLKN